MTSQFTLLALFAFVGLIGAAVDHWSTPLLGPTLARVGYGRAATQLGQRSYPREAIDSDGFRVRIGKPPRRIASQYWSIDEYLYSFVPPERVVAVSESAYLPGVSNVLEQTGRFRPVIAADPERVLRQSPDLILVASSSRSDFTALLRTSGIPVYRMFIDFTTLEQIEEYIRLIGYLTGEDERAEAVARRFHAEIERAKSLRPPDARPPRILGLGGKYSYGSHTLFHDVVKAAGGVNVAAENGLKGYDLVNGEQIARWNPEWIVAGANGGKIEETQKRIFADPAVALTEAGRTGHVLVLEYRVFLPMSPYASVRVAALAEALWK
jgi:iron complex transport system substrate-binding protein